MPHGSDCLSFFLPMPTCSHISGKDVKNGTLVSLLIAAEVKCVRLCFTLILAQASCVDSVPLSSFTSMEPRYCGKDTNECSGEDIEA